MNRQTTHDKSMKNACRISAMMPLLLVLPGCVIPPGSYSTEALPGEIEVTLRPVPAFIEKQAAGLSMPFFQAVPLARGHFFEPWNETGLYSGDTAIPADARVMTRWPDGSAQWIALSGVWPADRALDENTTVRIGSAAPKPLPPTWFTVRPHEVGIAVFQADGRRLAVLHPELSVLRIIRPKAPDSRDPDDLDTFVQYAWAADLKALNPESEPAMLTPCLSEFIVEKETPASILYRLRGNGGRDPPGSDLEWQMRVRVFRHAPVIRFQMTWFVHWDPEEWALASAQWVATWDEPLSSASGTGGEWRLCDGSVAFSNSPSGHGLVRHAGQTVFSSEWPDPNRHVWTAQHGSGALGIGAPDFTRLGPNRLTIATNGISLACWDNQSGLGLDLRSTVAKDEFGMNDADYAATARGVARTVDMVWTAHPDACAAGALAQAESLREGLWFASRKDLVRSQALGPWRESGFHRAGVDRRRGQVHFLMASRDYWRWNGFVNFGDIRTNWERKQREDGSHTARWALNGRYGWRQGSGEPYGKFLVFGLWAEDRDILLFAYDYARHVADVDVMHGRFDQPLRDSQGGMHRRNKNHWSGSVQMQYTPSRGLYLAKWLTGWERFDDTLKEIRDYAMRQGGSSVYGASAWLSRYTETHDPADLSAAEMLLERAAALWEGKNQERENVRDLRGLAALYAWNFRLYHDGWPVLMEFHRATGNPAYLDVVAERATALPRYPGYSFHYLMIYAYLISQGFPVERIDEAGREQIRLARESRQTGVDETHEAIKFDTWSYRSLEETYSMSASLALATYCGYMPLIQSWLFGDEARIP